EMVEAALHAFAGKKLSLAKNMISAKEHLAAVCLLNTYDVDSKILYIEMIVKSDNSSKEEIEHVMKIITSLLESANSSSELPDIITIARFVLWQAMLSFRLKL